MRAKFRWRILCLKFWASVAHKLDNGWECDSCCCYYSLIDFVLLVAKRGKLIELCT